VYQPPPPVPPFLFMQSQGHC